MLYLVFLIMFICYSLITVPYQSLNGLETYIYLYIITYAVDKFRQVSNIIDLFILTLRSPLKPLALKFILGKSVSGCQLPSEDVGVSVILLEYLWLRPELLLTSRSCCSAGGVGRSNGISMGKKYSHLLLPLLVISNIVLGSDYA